MTLTSELPPEVEGVLVDEARIAKMFAKWDAEDVTDGSDKLTQHNQDQKPKRFPNRTISSWEEARIFAHC